MDSIKKKVKYYSRQAAKYIYPTVILTFILLVVGYLKFKPVFAVKLSGQDIGLVSNNLKISNELENYLSDPTGPVAEAKLEEKPEFELKFVSKDVETNETEVKEQIDEKIEKTYRIYEVKIGDNVIASLETKEEADKIISEISEERSYTDLTVIETLSKTNTIQKYDDAKKVALDNVIQKQSEEKSAAESARQVQQARQIAYATTTSRSTERSYSVATSTSSTASSALAGMSFRTPIDNPRYNVGFGGYRGHTGQDIMGGGLSIKAANSGVVTTVKYLTTSYGRYIVIDHGNGISTLYAHCSTINVKVGQRVNKGDVIGITGNTGNSTGPHLHFEIRVNGKAINPRPYI